jgi:hypothetical protein
MTDPVPLRHELTAAPLAWIGPVGQLMPHEIFEAWSEQYPDQGHEHFRPLYEATQLTADRPRSYIYLEAEGTWRVLHDWPHVKEAERVAVPLADDLKQEITGRVFAKSGATLGDVLNAIERAVWAANNLKEPT